jgi:hypothetical protein
LTDDNIILASKILKEEYLRLDDHENIIPNRDKVLNNYKDIFSSKKIRNISWDQFSGFLKFENNNHWKGIDLQIKLGTYLKNNFDYVVNKLSTLLDETKPISERFNQANRIKDLGKAKISPILLIAYPDKYGVWNSVSEWCLKTLGIWLYGLPNKSEKKLSDGEVYEAVNNVLLRLSEIMEVDLWTLDAIFWYYYQSHSSQVSLALVEMAEYTKKDLSDIFTPEYSYTPQGGKWGRVGVVSLNLGISKNYVLFSVGEKFAKLDRPEAVMEDGTYDWVTQQRMKSKETPTVKSIKESNVLGINVLLFYKAKEQDQKFTYYGPLTFIDEYKDSSQNRRFIFKLNSWNGIKNRIICSSNVPVPSMSPSKDATMRIQQPPTTFNSSQNNSENMNRKGKFRSVKGDVENKKLGDSGEELVMKWEREKLKDHPDLLKKLERVSEKNDYLGYDIRSFDTDGKEIYIEVKTTRGGKSSSFIVTSNEYMSSKKYATKYRLYRLYNYNPKSGADCFILVGDLSRFNPRVLQYSFDPKD